MKPRTKIKIIHIEPIDKKGKDRNYITKSTVKMLFFQKDIGKLYNRLYLILVKKFESHTDQRCLYY